MDTPDSTHPGARAQAVLAARPSEGLFAGLDWRTATAPFSLTPAIARDIESMGRVLWTFYRAVNLLYRRSIEGRSPSWIAQWLDLGKPESLIHWQREHAFRQEIPRVIRPDLLLTENGLVITELDSVPGGIGLTTWLYQAYEAPLCPGDPPGASPSTTWLGSSQSMIHGFSGIFGNAPHAHIMISEESATYRPEMEWMAKAMSRPITRVCSPEDTRWQSGDAVYRFFELFDLAAVPAAEPLFAAAAAGHLRLTPPPKPLFEEKLLFALLWNRHLRDFWRQELGERFHQRMLQWVPYTWILDPTPLPPHGAIPELHLTDWSQLKALSQKERQLILKISGFSPQAWGARGVYLGSDLNSADWAAAVDRALAAWPRHPYVLQRFQPTAVVPGEWFDPITSSPIPMPSRVRLCPYFFVHGEGDQSRPHLGGVLATLCPADKKILHGMSDAILAPCSVHPTMASPTP